MLNEIMEVNVTFPEFPHICRICCSRTELKHFESLGHLVEVFQNITNIHVDLSVPLPKSFCSTCVLKLEEISKLIDSTKYIDSCLNRILLEEHMKKGTVKQENSSYEDSNLPIVEHSGEIIIKTEHVQSLFYDLPGPEEVTFEYHDFDNKIEINKLEIDYHKPDVKLETTVRETEIQYQWKGKHCSLRRKKHRKVELYRCEVCFKDLATPALKKSHLKSHFDKYVICFGCGKSFTKKYEYMNHCKSHYVKGPILRCKVCRQVFPAMVGLKKHACGKHLQRQEEKRETTQNYPKNLKLKKSTGTKSSVRLGRYHKAAKPFPCKVCSKPFTTSQRLQFHQRTHTSGESSYLCEVCLECFSNLQSLRQHRSSHIGNLFRCAICSFSFATKPSLEKHLITHKERPYRCLVCLKHFSREQHLQHHKKIHSEEKRFKCSMCPKTFAYLSNFRAHLISHTGERHHRCSVCSHYFTTKQSLRRHAEVHEGEKSFHCPQCPRSFFYQFNLNRHLKNHAPAKQCRYCSRTFSMNHRLRAHERTHTGEKPFSCDVCGRCFSDSSHLCEHKRTHTGEKRFQCEFCLKRYARKRYMMVHRKKCEENVQKESLKQLGKTQKNSCYRLILPK